jgi:threonine dehydratase
LQVSGAYKIRGATIKIARLNKRQRERGVIAASAGNHAQGVAIAATNAKVKNIIVMPLSAPEAKKRATQAYQRREPTLGSEVVSYGENFDQAYEHARELGQREGYVFVEPFNDEDIIAGQGTIGLEIYEQLPDLDVVLTGVGGGGLIAGIAVAMEHVAQLQQRPVRVIGVEAAGAASMRAALDAGHVVELEQVDTIADGIKTKKVGEIPFTIVQALVAHDDIVTVDDDDIKRAMGLLLERCKLQVEGAGAVGVAAMLARKVDVSGKTVVVVLSGGNLDMNTLAEEIKKEQLSTAWMDTYNAGSDPDLERM